jgi:hypothetical protein
MQQTLTRNQTPWRRWVSVTASVVVGGGVLAYISQLIGPATQVRTHGFRAIQVELAKLPPYPGSELDSTTDRGEPFAGESVLQAFASSAMCNEVQFYYAVHARQVGWPGSGTPTPYPGNAEGSGDLLSGQFGKHVPGYHLSLSIQCYVNLVGYTVDVEAN